MTDEEKKRAEDALQEAVKSLAVASFASLTEKFVAKHEASEVREATLERIKTIREQAISAAVQTLSANHHLILQLPPPQ